MPLRTLGRWKTEKPLLYNRLKWSYEAEQLLQEIVTCNDDIQVKTKELLKDR